VDEFAFEEPVSTGQIDRKNQYPLDKIEEFKSIKSGAEGTTAQRHYCLFTLETQLVICFAYWRQILALLLDQARPCGK
jgi:hypothetical protein